jgi:hypothetical protein
MSAFAYRLRFSAAPAALFALMLLASGCAGAAPNTIEVPQKESMKESAATTASNRLAADDFDSRAIGRASKSAKAELAANDPLGQVQDNPTGTFVGQRTQELLNDITKVRGVVATRNNELQDIRRAAATAAVTYHSSVAAVEARLQAGTTPGNPILLRQWDEAQANLDQMNSSVSRLNTLSTEVSADGSMVGYLLGSVKAAFELNGAIDEDHDNLKVLQDVVSQQVVGIERMKTEISQDLLRLNSYLNTERSNLQTLAFAIDRGEYLGNNLANRPVVLTPAPTSTMGGQSANIPNTYGSVAYGNASNAAIQAAPLMPSAAAANMMGSAPAAMADQVFDPNARMGVATGVADTSFGMLPSDSAVRAGANPTLVPQTQNLSELPAFEDNKLLALIRFNTANVQFEKQLYDAVSQALDQMPAAVFTVNAVSPASGGSAAVAAGTAEAQRHADAVKRSLISMGLPPNRIAMTATGSRDANVPEVHVMVR